MINARIDFDVETGSGELYYKGQYLCQVMLKGLHTDLKEFLIVIGEAINAYYKEGKQVKRKDYELVAEVIRKSKVLTKAEKFCLVEEFIKIFIKNGGNFDVSKFRVASGTAQTLFKEIEK